MSNASFVSEGFAKSVNAVFRKLVKESFEENEIVPGKIPAVPADRAEVCSTPDHRKRSYHKQIDISQRV